MPSLICSNCNQREFVGVSEGAPCPRCEYGIVYNVDLDKHSTAITDVERIKMLDITINELRSWQPFTNQLKRTISELEIYRNEIAYKVLAATF